MKKDIAKACWSQISGPFRAGKGKAKCWKKQKVEMLFISLSWHSFQNMQKSLKRFLNELPLCLHYFGWQYSTKSCWKTWSIWNLISIIQENAESMEFLIWRPGFKAWVSDLLAKWLWANHFSSEALLDLRVTWGIVYANYPQSGLMQICNHHLRQWSLGWDLCENHLKNCRSTSWFSYP